MVLSSVAVCWPMARLERLHTLEQRVGEGLGPLGERAVERDGALIDRGQELGGALMQLPCR